MTRKRAIRKTKHELAYRPSTTNIAIADTTAPIRAVSQLKKWNDGRKFGAEPILRRKQARFMTRKVIYQSQIKILFQNARGNEEKGTYKIR